MKKIVLCFLVLLLVVVTVGCNNEPRGETFVGEWVNTRTSKEEIKIERFEEKFLVEYFWESESSGEFFAVLEEEQLRFLEGIGEHYITYFEESDQILVSGRRFNRK